MATDPADGQAIAPPLVLEAPPPAVIAPLRDAVIAPVGRGPGFANGVFDRDGRFCGISRTRISENRLTDIPALPSPMPADRLSGRYLFAGIGRHHFGHFLMETASRIWALDGREGLFDGLVILPVPDIDFAAVLRRRMRLFFDLMGCDMAIHLIETPMRIDMLYVPTQGFGHLHWAVGHEAFRRFVRHRIAMTCPAVGPEKVYVSRSKLKYAYQSIDQEERIERLMESAGYSLFHPERHDMRTQCQVYRAARVIVGGDGSAFHLAPFAMADGARVGLIQRRARLAPVEAIADQINAFAAVDLVRLDPLRAAADGSPAPSVGRTGQQPISFRALKAQLEAADLI